MSTTQTLAAQRCQHQEQALAEAEMPALLAATPGWQVEGGKLCKTFAFENYYQTLAFVNAIAWVIHADDHHPELVVTYNRCVVRFDTHSVNGGKGGLSINDFICAAKLELIAAQGSAHAG
ncbi:4a-hydroxytetrahydrobiopterin dehydratase [Massilia sp. W12]|uniref:4a-hydroxytetrahydrobiopterin dehydratase n=1 Tax=Massilia sp. W12 TaxID=3126507 RepID=UPI0030D5DF01